MKVATKWARLVATTFVVAVSVPVAGVASVPAVATEVEAVSAGCEASTQHLIESQPVQAAAAEAGSEVAFTCVDELVTVQVEDPLGETTALVAETTTEGEMVDLTGMSEQEIAEAGPTIQGGSVSMPTVDKTNSPDATTINHSYRASTNDTVYWGSRTSAGVLLWSSSARITSYISLQQKLHPFNVGYTSLGGRQIVMTVPVDMMQHQRYLQDKVIDTNYWGPTYYGTSYSATKNLLTTGSAGKFYPRLRGMYLDDRTAGRRFYVGGTITYPRFQCYSTGSCKYPNGVEAAW